MRLGGCSGLFFAKNARWAKSVLRTHSYSMSPNLTETKKLLVSLLGARLAPDYIDDSSTPST